MLERCSDFGDLGGRGRHVAQIDRNASAETRVLTDRVVTLSGNSSLLRYVKRQLKPDCAARVHPHMFVAVAVTFDDLCSCHGGGYALTMATASPPPCLAFSRRRRTQGTHRGRGCPWSAGMVVEQLEADPRSVVGDDVAVLV
jgi:hypothetical protein